MAAPALVAGMADMMICVFLCRVGAVYGELHAGPGLAPSWGSLPRPARLLTGCPAGGRWVGVALRGVPVLAAPWQVPGASLMQ